MAVVLYDSSNFTVFHQYTVMASVVRALTNLLSAFTDCKQLPHQISIAIDWGLKENGSSDAAAFHPNTN